MLPLPDTLRDALQDADGRPVRLTDSATGQEYLLVSAEGFDHLTWSDEPPSLDEQQELLRRAGLRAGWDDPAMDVYDELDPRRQS